MDKELLIALITSGTAGWLLKIFYEEIKAHIKGRHPFKNVYAKIHQVYSKINLLKSELSATRVLILKTENGGGKPKVGATLFSSILYESSGNIESIKERWQREPLDEKYINTMLDLDVREVIRVYKSDLNEDTKNILHLMLEVSCCEGAELHKIFEGETRYIYMMIMFPEGMANNYSAKQQDTLRFVVKELKNLFIDDENI